MKNGLRSLLVGVLVATALAACSGGTTPTSVQVVVDGRGLTPDDQDRVRIVCLTISGDGDGGTTTQVFQISGLKNGEYSFDYKPSNKSGLLTLSVTVKALDGTPLATNTLVIEVIDGKKVPAVIVLGSDGDDAGPDASVDGAVTPTDLDGDGYSASVDCNDNDPTVHPGATEVCDGVDNDCNGMVDEGVKITFYGDSDNDGFGVAATTTQACTPPAGYVGNSMDCNDNDASIHPGAAEQCNNVDDDCDGMIDDNVVSQSFYRDADNDGFGAAGGTAMVACRAPTGFVANNRDCNDAAAGVHPGATETCNGADDNCDGMTDEGVKLTFYRDMDGDGSGNAAMTTQACAAPAGYVATSTDCNDGAAAVHPGATETCNGVDDNCNGMIDEGVQTTFYRDADNDSYGTMTLTTQACAAPAGYVARAGDCNDAAAAVHPTAAEVCNGIDDDCNTMVDDGLVTSSYYVDGDNDGFGRMGSVATVACRAPAGFVGNNTDCNDAVASTHPGAPEQCNGVDDNCNTMVDDGVVTSSYYRDADGDGFGAAGSVAMTACSAPAGYVLTNTDCNDGAAAVHPGATEVCNGIDDNCGGGIDEGVTNTYYRDMDADSYGNAAVTIQACSAPAGYVVGSTDCDDTRGTVHPGGTESCNGLDDNCNGMVDEGVKSTFYRDADGDSFGALGVTTQACAAPAGYVVNSTDCNDGAAAVHPGAAEACNGIDDNCVGGIDEGLTFSNYYTDGDGDGYGTGAAVSACAPVAGRVLNSTDCDDSKATVHPGATEVCNLIDDNCVGGIDEGVLITYYRDVDGDAYGQTAMTVTGCSLPAGYAVMSGDCNDVAGAGAAIHPGATEVCNQIDDNCSGAADEGLTVNTYYRDADSDGYGTAATTTMRCNAPAGYVASSTDCNDANMAVHPLATEVCNGIDDNCVGGIDEGVTPTWYRDADGDGYGTSATTLAQCTMPVGYVANNTDCNDGAAGVHPGATEVCNGVDDDCSGVADNGLTFMNYYTDADADGYGATTSGAVSSCVAIAGRVTNNTDCNDVVANGGAAVHPGATEVCNQIDDNCSGAADEGIALNTYYRDADGDGYGTSATTTMRCNAPAGYVANSTDCNDGAMAVHPGATEVCNGIDDNCVGGIDEGLLTTYYKDFDGDGYGTAVTQSACSLPSGYATLTGDCNDGVMSINPGASEVCNNAIDDNCNGSTDEGCPPVNDKCPGAIDISNGGDFTYDLNNAKQDIAARCSGNGPEVYFYFQIKESEEIYLDAYDSAGAPVAIELYQLNAGVGVPAGCGQLEPFGCDLRGGASCGGPSWPRLKTTISVTGQRYYVVALRGDGVVHAGRLRFQHVPVACASGAGQGGDLTSGTPLTISNNCHGDKYAPSCAQSNQDTNFVIMKCPETSLGANDCSGSLDTEMQIYFGSMLNTGTTQTPTCRPASSGTLAACAKRGTCANGNPTGAQVANLGRGKQGLYTIDVDSAGTCDFRTILTATEQ